MAQASPERASGGNQPRGSPSGPRKAPPDRPLTDGHLLALLGAADPDLLAAISILALSGMRLAELRRLRVAQCGRGAFRVGACAANDGPREVPVHSALAGTVLRLTRGRAGDAFLIGDGAEFGRAPSLTERRFDACRRAAVGVAGPPPTIHDLRRWFVRTALDAEQPPAVVAAVVGHFHPGDARPKPTWGQRCACVEAVTLPKATS
jgi:integrase